MEEQIVYIYYGVGSGIHFFWRKKNKVCTCLDVSRDKNGGGKKK